MKDYMRSVHNTIVQIQDRVSMIEGNSTCADSVRYARDLARYVDSLMKELAESEFNYEKLLKTEIPEIMAMIDSQVVKDVVDDCYYYSKGEREIFIKGWMECALRITGGKFNKGEQL